MDQGKSVSEYMAHIDEMIAKLASYGKPVSEQSVMAKVMSGLPPEYGSLKRAWDLTPAQFKSMNLLLRKEERLLKDTRITGDALVAKATPGRRNRRRGTPDENKKSSKCNYCQQSGHWWRECPTRPEASAQIGK